VPCRARFAQAATKGEIAYQRGDFATARRLLLRPAEHGDAYGELLLGNIASAREGTPDDIREAARWYRMAADKGLAAAQAKLAACYAAGSGVEQSDAQAVQWYLRAARQGDVQAAASLGYYYQLGNDVPHDDAEAARWYRVAAEHGDTLSQNMLGDFYTSGIGVDRNPREAAAWYRRAAEQGDPQGQYQLALAYSEGTGVPRDAVAAFVWVSLALDSPSEKKIEREPATRLASAMARELTKSQTDEAQHRLALWRPSPGAASQIDAADGTLRALVVASGKGGESRVDIREGARLLLVRSYASPDGRHGFVVQHAAWTPDSRFFVFSLTSSGGHQPWHYPTYLYSRQTNRLVSLDGRIGPLAEPDFRLSAPDVLNAKVIVNDGPPHEVQLKLGELSRAKR